MLGDGLAYPAAPHPVLTHEASLLVLFLLVRLQASNSKHAGRMHNYESQLEPIAEIATMDTSNCDSPISVRAVP